ncbi:MAG: hypothetical protein PHI27_12825 [Eubacteriales bacterium]|nr:hypothetical protein [Eubacteriales bacterium]MDD3883105.1 hypothetical protein [Eubacteriales bacterium]MDD4513325.1 hypothetical protein [Eubacteriales bacterium]
MFFYTSLQGAAFLVFALCGALCALVVCALAQVSRRLRSAVFSAALQLLATLCCFALLLAAIVITNQGSLRLFMLLAIALGAVVFVFGVYNPLRRFISKFFAKRGGASEEARLG